MGEASAETTRSEGQEYSSMSSMRSEVLAKLFILSKARPEVGSLSIESLDAIEKYMDNFESMPFVYITGPYSNDPTICVQRAFGAANLVLNKGGIPIIPHLTHFWHLFTPRPYEFWLAYDLHMISTVKNIVALRLPGSSRGADLEVLFFLDSKKKVFSLEEVQDERFDFREHL